LFSAKIINCFIFTRYGTVITSSSVVDPYHFVTWIRIRIKQKYPNPHTDPHQSDKLDLEPDPHQFADDNPKCMEYEPILARVPGLEPLFRS
jgi:hypothetical protein